MADLGRLCIDTDTAGGLFFGDSGFAVTISGIDSINPLTLDIGAMAEDGVTQLKSKNYRHILKAKTIQNIYDCESILSFSGARYIYQAFGRIYPNLKRMWHQILTQTRPHFEGLDFKRFIMTQSSFYDPLVLTNLLCHEFIAAGVSQLAASQGSASSLDIYCPVYCSTATRAYLAQQSVGASIMIRENPRLILSEIWRFLLAF